MQKTFRIELKEGGKTKIVWVSIGSKKDFNTFKFGIDKLFDEVEENNK